MATRINSLFITPLLLICQLFLLMAIEGVESIGCFVCSSFNGSNPSCEDTFNSTIQHGSQTTPGAAQYQYPCWAFMKQRQGLFPADHCIKVNGYRSDEPTQTMVIRTCALDSGTLTADTEIVRISHCGHFKYEGYQYSGCVQACDTDGCNAATTHHSCSFLIVMLSVVVVLLVFTSYEHFDKPEPLNHTTSSLALQSVEQLTRLALQIWHSFFELLSSSYVVSYQLFSSRAVHTTDIT